MEQRQRFRQREGLKERSAVVDTVEHGIYEGGGEQWTEGGSHISYSHHIQSTPDGELYHHFIVQRCVLVGVGKHFGKHTYF